jgi:hypothetical protein
MDHQEGRTRIDEEGRTSSVRLVACRSGKAEGTSDANTEPEVLQEILHVYDARKERRKGFDTIDDLLVLFPNPIPIGREEIEIARDLMRSYSFLRDRDAIHAAVVLISKASSPPIKSLTE